MQSHGTFLKASMKGLPILLLFYFIANVLLKYMTKCFFFFFLPIIQFFLTQLNIVSSRVH